MHGLFIRNLKRATRYVFRGDRHRHASAGYEPAVYRAGRRARKEKPRPAWLEFCFWTWPVVLLVGMGLVGDRGWAPPFFGWFIVSACAIALGVAAPLSRPHKGMSYWILSLNLAGIAFCYFAAGIGG